MSKRKLVNYEITAYFFVQEKSDQTFFPAVYLDLKGALLWIGWRE